MQGWFSNWKIIIFHHINRSKPKTKTKIISTCVEKAVEKFNLPSWFKKKTGTAHTHTHSKIGIERNSPNLRKLMLTSFLMLNAECFSPPASMAKLYILSTLIQHFTGSSSQSRRHRKKKETAHTFKRKTKLPLFTSDMYQTLKNLLLTKLWKLSGFRSFAGYKN